MNTSQPNLVASPTPSATTVSSSGNRANNDPHETSPARILVVDDQPMNVQIVGSILGKLGHEIVPAFDGATMFKRIAARVPDLILLDLLMPGMGGCEICAQLMANPEWKDIPVIFLSAANDKDLIVRALDAGGVDYLTKPFNHAELVSRVRTQLALKSARDRLRQLAEDRDELLGILAHDLKNHLGGINMSAELLLKAIQKFDDERVTRLAENMVRSSGLSLAFVKEFLADAAADRDFPIQLTKLNLVDVVTAVTQQYQESAKRKKLAIQLDCPVNPVNVIADAAALRQVLDNLVSNAIKFSPAERNVFLTVQIQDRCGECAVRDEGPGFTSEDKARMYKRYGRLSAKPTDNEPSTGLGLSIVRKLVQEMKGEIHCESSPGNGATFTVRLPQPIE